LAQKLKANLIAGKIISAIATTTAMATGVLQLLQQSLSQSHVSFMAGW
jgi:hypothetical protein